MRTACLVLCIIAAPTLQARTQGDDRRELLKQAAERIRQLQAEADRLASQTGTLLNELRALELERAIKAEELTAAEAALTPVTVALDATTARVASLEAQRLAETPGLRERLAEIYKRGQGGYVRLLLEAHDMRALGRMSRGVASVAQLDRVRVDTHRRTLRDERAALSALQRQRTAHAAAQAAAGKARQALDRAVAAHNRRLDELDQRRDLAARYIGELQKAQADLQRTVGTLGASGGTALPLAPFRGELEWPIRGRLLSRFGRSPAGRFGTAIARNGIEIAAGDGAPVRAVHGGTVAFAAPFSGYGTLVIVDHAHGAFTLYGHLRQATVARGARVGRGDELGRAGRTPAGIPAAYFELRIDGRPVDPVQWLRSIR